MLIDIGAVESVGKGRGRRYLLSHSLYAAMGSGGKYTRVRGLDRETNKSLLLMHLGKVDAVGCPLSELRQVLPAMTDREVQGLLKELQNEGRVILAGQRRWAKWHLAK